MLTNCSNCGAPLTKDGWCDYCKTKVRLALYEIKPTIIGNDPEIKLTIDWRLCELPEAEKKEAKNERTR